MKQKSCKVLFLQQSLTKNEIEKKRWTVRKKINTFLTVDLVFIQKTAFALSTPTLLTVGNQTDIESSLLGNNGCLKKANYK